MVTERTTYDQITILEDGQIQLRRVRILFDAGWRGTQSAAVAGRARAR